MADATTPGPSGSSSTSLTSNELEISSDESFGSNEEESSSSVSGIPADKSKVVALLSRLKPPQPSDLARKRKTACSAPKGMKKSKGSTSAEPKSINPQQRLRQFPSEPLIVSNRRLFCNTYREQLSMKMSSLKNHIQSSKHKDGVKRLKSKEAREKNIAEALKAHNHDAHLKGESLPENHQVYRLMVVMCFLRAEVPLRKFIHFRELLEENAFRLSDRRYMSDLIPFVLREEQQVKRDQLKQK